MTPLPWITTARVDPLIVWAGCRICGGHLAHTTDDCAGQNNRLNPRPLFLYEGADRFFGAFLGIGNTSSAYLPAMPGYAWVSLRGKRTCRLLGPHWITNGAPPPWGTGDTSYLRIYRTGGATVEPAR